MPPSKHKAESSDGSAATAADMSTVQADSGGEISHVSCWSVLVTMNGQNRQHAMGVFQQVNKSRPVMKRRGLRKTGSKAA